jgi:hypothetical protein
VSREDSVEMNAIWIRIRSIPSISPSETKSGSILRRDLSVSEGVNRSNRSSEVSEGLSLAILLNVDVWVMSLMEIICVGLSWSV